MTDCFADRLLLAIREKKAPVCVGLDPVLERLPSTILQKFGLHLTKETGRAPVVDREVAVRAIQTFGEELLSTVAPFVPAVKINIAFFEPYGADGIRVYHALIRLARRLGLIVIGDVKRADIGHSATQYANAHLEGVISDRFRFNDLHDEDVPDAVTVNPYFGYDAVKPFVEGARRTGRGVFVLVQTSNESAAAVQGLTLSDGETLCQRVAQMVQEWAVAEEPPGTSGYSCVGAVVSPRDIPSTVRIRTLMPNCIFLVPGFGAQGRTAEEVGRCFKSDGTGAIVTASRSVIFAHEGQICSEGDGGNWQLFVREACREFIGAVARVVPR